MFHYYTNRPATNEYQFEDKYIIQVILPGHTKEELSIEVQSGNRLVIQSKPEITPYKELISKDEDYIIDKFHPTCDKWIFGVKDIYEYVWFEKASKN